MGGAKMKIKDVDKLKLENGEYCRKGRSGCFCEVGYPYEKMCPDCRDNREKGGDKDFCICPPPETNNS